jgi:hypothetical protein
MQGVFDQLGALTETFCREHLSPEYADLCRRIAAALCRKRPSPLGRGNIEGWACGIVYAAGAHNFLFDRSEPLHMSSAELAGTFGVSKGTAAARAKSIRDALRIRDFDWHWTLPSLLDELPFAWMIEIDGIVVDVRQTSRNIQEEALRRGLIPYLPAP